MYCRIDGNVFPLGEMQKRKQEAKHAAARKALEVLLGISSLTTDAPGRRLKSLTYRISPNISTGCLELQFEMSKRKSEEYFWLTNKLLVHEITLVVDFQCHYCASDKLKMEIYCF